MTSPLHEPELFRVGPLSISGSLLTSFGLTIVLLTIALVIKSRLREEPGPVQAFCEVIVTTIQEQIEQVTHSDGKPYLPIIATLFIFLLSANSLSLFPGLVPPTERIETVAALSITVLCSVYFYGMKRHGIVGYLKHFFQPTPFLFPIHILSEITRTFSLSMRLFGNIMSHGLILAVIVSVAGLFLPIPVILFGLFTGAVQAYIFTILATVYIAAAVEEHPQRGQKA